MHIDMFPEENEAVVQALLADTPSAETWHKGIEGGWGPGIHRVEIIQLNINEYTVLNHWNWDV